MTVGPPLRQLRGEFGTWIVNGANAVLVSSESDLTIIADDVHSALDTAGTAACAASTYGATVMLTTRCNLTCEYCYQNMPAGDGNRIPSATLAPIKIDAVVAFLQDRMQANEKTRLNLLLTGGEPLLQYATSAALLQALKPIGLAGAEMFTNGVLLTPTRARALSDAGLTRIQVSFDGVQQDHDRYRRDRAGSGSYSRILRNLQQTLAAAPDLEVVARLNVSASNLSRLEQLINDLHENLGSNRVTLRIGMLDDIGIGFDDSPTASTATRNHVVNAAIHAVDLGFAVDPMATTDGCLYCGVIGGASGCVINADGRLYSCWESVGRPGFEVGHVDLGFLPIDELSDRWVDCSYNVSASATDRALMSSLRDAVDIAVLDRTYGNSVCGASR